MEKVKKENEIELVSPKNKFQLNFEKMMTPSTEQIVIKHIKYVKTPEYNNDKQDKGPANINLWIYKTYKIWSNEI